MSELHTTGEVTTNLDKSFAKISGPASSICLRLCVVSKPTTLQPAARPLRTPEGASSNTTPSTEKPSCQFDMPNQFSPMTLTSG